MQFLGPYQRRRTAAGLRRGGRALLAGVAELQSLVTLEAMATGKPVIAANAMALPHLCHPGVNGFLFEPGDIGQLAVQLETLLIDGELRAAMGRASLRISEYSSAATVDTLVGLYAGLVQNSRVRSAA